MFVPPCALQPPGPELVGTPRGPDATDFAGWAAGAASGFELTGAVGTTSPEETVPVKLGSEPPLDLKGLPKGSPERRMFSELQAAARLPISPTAARRDTERNRSTFTGPGIAAAPQERDHRDTRIKGAFRLSIRCPRAFGGRKSARNRQSLRSEERGLSLGKGGQAKRRSEIL